MRTLLVMRHAKSSWAEPGRPDHDRPLNERGKADAPRMGRLLLAEGLVPDQILASDARRARKTAERVAAACGFEGPIDLRPELYAAPPETCLEALADLAADVRCALLIGHNPGLNELVTRLTGRLEELPTAAVAVIELPVPHWDRLRDAPPRGRLLRVYRPRELREPAGDSAAE